MKSFKFNQTIIFYCTILHDYIGLSKCETFFYCSDCSSKLMAPTWCHYVIIMHNKHSDRKDIISWSLCFVILFICTLGRTDNKLKGVLFFASEEKREERLNCRTTQLTKGVRVLLAKIHKLTMYNKHSTCCLLLTLWHLF